MINYRRKGLIQIYTGILVLMACVVWVALLLLIDYLPLSPLAPDINHTLYLMMIAAGVLLGGHHMTQLQTSLYALRWSDALTLAFKQTFYVAFSIFLFVAASKDMGVSRLYLATYLVILLPILFFCNLLIPRWLCSAFFAHSHEIRTLVVGPNTKMLRMKNWILEKRLYGLVPAGYLTDDDYSDAVQKFGPYLGSINELSKVLEKERISQVILLGIPPDQTASNIFQICEKSGTRLLIHDDIYDQLPYRISAVFEGGKVFLTAMSEPLEDPFNRGMKRILDIAISLPVVLFVLPPLCLFVFLFQRFQSPGPLFFTRPRGGRDREEFLMYKFRSMHHAKADPGKEAVQAAANDTRVFTFGKFLRKSSLDEFPQFINVLKGDMSLVGPRPHVPQHDQEFSKIAQTYRVRHLVKPGITGYAQVNGYRGEISDPVLLQRRVEFDIRYITEWSFWLDIKIIFLTFIQIFRPPRTAY